MKEDNTNQDQKFPKTGEFEQPGQPYPQSGFPQSGQPYPHSGFPQSGQPYPHSGFPQSGQPYPPSGFPPSGQPYPPSDEYGYESKTKTSHIAIIAVIAVLIVSLATALIIVLHNRNQQQGMNPPPPPPPMMGNVSPGSVILNGQQITFDVLTEDGKTYLPVKDFAEAVGYDYVADGDKIKIIAPTEISILELDSTAVSLEDQTAGVKTNVEITKAPFKNDDIVYIYARDLALFLKNVTVTYNPQMQIVEINVGMGGPGMPPGGMPPGGMPPQPQQGGMYQPEGMPPQPQQAQDESGNNEPPQGESQKK